jgi:hypothetical protein
MKKWKKIAIGCSAVALMMSTLFTASLAWFTSKNNADLGTGQGYTASAYFAGGDGSAANPFVINRPIHLYNLAWLQYLGIFNQTDSSNNIKQKHFVLASDLDMTGWVLPPIGTSDNPFMGSFSGDPGDGSGNYYVVKNLTVDNSLGTGHIEKKPSSVTSVTGVNIVGMFGVVGNYDGMYSSTTNTSGLAVYDSSANYVKDFYLDQATIKTQLKSTLMGVCAGYVNAPVTGVGVSASKLDVLSGSYKFRSDFTSNISDYTTIGYCTADYKGTRSVSKTDVKAGATSTAYFSSLNSGANAGWGGSIDFSSVYTRLKGYRDDTSSYSSTLDTSTIVSSETITTDGTTSTTSNQQYYTTSGQIKNYYDSSTPLKGSYSFDYYDTDVIYANTAETARDFIYLYGKKEWTKQVTTNTVVYTGTTYGISYSGTYLAVSGTSLTSTTTPTYIWNFSNLNGDGTVSTVIGNTTYYLTGASGGRWGGTVSLSTTSTSTWTKSGNTLKTVVSGTTNYLEYYQGWDLATRAYTETNLTIARSSTTTGTGTATKLSAVTNDTYFPLNVGDDGLPAQTNTGYIVGGSTYNASTYYRSGDSRVSRYFMSDIYKSLDGTSSSATFDSSKFEILTQTSSSGLVRIKDDQGTGNNPTAGHTPTNSDLSGKTGYLYSALGLQKYKNSRKSLDSVLGASTNTAKAIYGMHFMDASITKTNKVTVPICRINRKDYSQYEMPRDSIDFNLQDKGFINFFSGTYFSGNTTFFSLHKIERTTAADLSSSTISSIKEISKVYAPTAAYLATTPAAPYIYSYWNDTAHTSETQASAPNTNYTLKFDMTWVTNPTMITNAVYYFEIPVNAGEYALGSVSGKDGSYLMYLDISANAQPISRTVITEYILTAVDTYSYPLGIQIVADPATGKTTIDDLDSAATTIKSNLFSGTFTVSRSANTITFTTDNSNFSPGFKGDNVTLAGQTTSGGSLTVPDLVPSAPETTSYIKRMTYIDYNMVLGTTTRTIFTSTNGTMTYSYIDSSGTVSTPTNITNNNGELVLASTIADSSIPYASLTNTIAEYWYSYFASKTIVTSTFAFTYTLAPGTIGTENGQIASISGYTITLTSTGDTITIHVNLLTATYTVTLNGTTVATGPIPTA